MCTRRPPVPRHLVDKAVRPIAILDWSVDPRRRPLERWETFWKAGIAPSLDGCQTLLAQNQVNELKEMFLAWFFKNQRPCLFKKNFQQEKRKQQFYLLSVTLQIDHRHLPSMNHPVPKDSGYSPCDKPSPPFLLAAKAAFLVTLILGLTPSSGSWTNLSIVRMVRKLLKTLLLPAPVVYLSKERMGIKQGDPFICAQMCTGYFSFGDGALHFP